MSVRTPGGTLRGERVGEVGRFLRIPYAAAPVGDRRWAAPVAAEPWDDERDATSPGPAPPKPQRPINEWFHGPLAATCEADGLSLNVFAPVGEGGTPTDGSRPVLVGCTAAAGRSAGAPFDGLPGLPSGRGRIWQQRRPVLLPRST